MLRGQEHGIQIRIYFMIDHGHLELTFKVRSGPQAFNDDAFSFFTGILCQQFPGEIHFHIGKIAGDPLD